MPFFTTEHHRLYYITQGSRSQPPLLLLHGFMGSHQDFSEIVSSLSHHFYCIVPDLPGHGQTQSQPHSYTLSKTTDSLLSLLSHIGIYQTHLLGYSMGGRLALYMACEFPDCFIRLVLESASPGLKTVEERERRQKSDGAIAHRLHTTPLPTFLDQWYRNPLFASLQNHPQQYKAMLERRINNKPAELARALKGMGTGQQPSLWAALEQIQQPALLITGALDTKFVAINREMADAMDHKRQLQLKIVESCGHNLHLESSAVYVRIVLLFLKDLSLVR